MSAGDRDTLAALLAGHNHWSIDDDADMTPRCKCGHPVMVDGRIAHRAHVADVLLASGWLAGVRRDAFDEGWNECVDHRRTCDYQGPGECPDMPDPCRTTEDTDPVANSTIEH